MIADHPLAAYWRCFREQFSAQLQGTEKLVLQTAWSSSAERTSFYSNTLLPRVADALNLAVKTELFKVDVALCAKSSTGHDVPLIFVESENNAFTATHEVSKLCCLSAPLRVLITCVEWNETPDFWPSGGTRARLLSEWQDIMRAHCQFWPQPGVIGILVGEWGTDNKLRFYAMAIGNNGDTCESESIVFEEAM